MKRFIFIAIIICSLLAVSSGAVAEERLIAIIMAGGNARYQEVQTAFTDSFCSDNCKIYAQTPNADTMSLRNSVRKAVALDAELIITYGPSATLAARIENPPMPILFADVYDPVSLGLVSEKTGVGDGISGVRGDAPVQALLKYFVESTGADTLAVLYDKNSEVGKLQQETLVASGKRRKIDVTPLMTSAKEDHLVALARMNAETDGLFMANSDHEAVQLTKVVEYAMERKIPVLTQRPGAASLGAFMTLETSAKEQGEKLAKMADKLLSGAEFSELALEKPHDVSFVVNLKAAELCDIKVPFTVLSNATKVVK